MKDDIGGTCSTCERDEKLIQYVGWKPEGKRSLGRPRHRWEDNIRMDLREILGEGVDWIHLAQDMDLCWALVNLVNEPLDSIKGGEFLD
jgi:hypothetical protein